MVCLTCDKNSKCVNEIIVKIDIVNCPGCKSKSVLAHGDNGGKYFYKVDRMR